jgi:hypothetical protein
MGLVGWLAAGLPLQDFFAPVAGILENFLGIASDRRLAQRWETWLSGNSIPARFAVVAAPLGDAAGCISFVSRPGRGTK